MSLIAEAVNPADVRDEFDQFITDLAATEHKAARLVPMPTESASGELRRIRKAAARAGFGVRVVDRTEDGDNTVFTLALGEPVVRPNARGKRTGADVAATGTEPGDVTATPDSAPATATPKGATKTAK
jgi:hypothetical protein